MKWICIFVIVFALSASAKTIEQVDLEWKARGLKAKEAHAKFKPDKSTPAYQNQILWIEFAFSLFPDPNTPLIERVNNYRYYSLLFPFGESYSGDSATLTHVTYVYDETTGALERGRARTRCRRICPKCAQKAFQGKERSGTETAYFVNCRFSFSSVL